MSDTTGFLIYLATVVVLIGSVVLADVTRSVTITDTDVTVHAVGLKVSVPVADVRRVVREETGQNTVRVVVLGRRPWQSVRVEAATGSADDEALRSFLDAAGKHGAPVILVPPQAA
jgi:hypothetical protein